MSPSNPIVILRTVNSMPYKFLLIAFWIFVTAVLENQSSVGEESKSSVTILDKQQVLEAQTFWDNQDWDWYRNNIPFFECPDAEITTTYYYRWELLTKHLTYGSPNTGYLFTEFIDRPFWSGAYGAISCPAGHQLYESRWLRDSRITKDYIKYYFRTPGSQPRNYSTWIADATWAFYQVHSDASFAIDLLPDLVKNYEGWEQRHFVPQVGLFWQTGHDDGMEFNINSRQTKDILRGAPSYRPSFNAYMWADAVAIAKIARLANQMEIAERFDQKAASIKSKVQELLWDEKRLFFFPAFRDNEEADGFQVKALSRTYESGRHAGDPHGRELIGYVPWQFNMLDSDKGFEIAWEKLVDRDAFQSKFGPTTVERFDPMFLLKDSCCWWSGQSWPYATSQTLKAMANVLQANSTAIRSNALPITNNHYTDLLHTFAVSHRKDGKPYLAEALHPDTGSFQGHDAFNHSEHYFHSSYCDLVITGLAGLREQSDNTIIVSPLAPKEWDYFAVDDVPYHGHLVSILWDRDGSRYKRGAGLTVLVDGNAAAHSAEMTQIKAIIPPVKSTSNDSSLKLHSTSNTARINFAVNNDGDYFPRLTASYVAVGSSLSKVNDGNYWYHISPPNRWTTMGSPNEMDWIEVDFGTPRKIDIVKLYFLDDGEQIFAPKDFSIQYAVGDVWKDLPESKRSFEIPIGHKPNTVQFKELEVERLRIAVVHQSGKRSGLTEIEAWGSGDLPYKPASPPAGNIAFNATKQGFPKATASFTDRFGGHPMSAIDGKIIFLPTPMNRWTSYESPNDVDWLELDFGKEVSVGRIDLHIYDDRGGVQPPKQIAVEYRDNDQWINFEDSTSSPQKPTGNVVNSIRFAPKKTRQIRVLFTNAKPARSGITEIEVWEQ